MLAVPGLFALTGARRAGVMLLLVALLYWLMIGFRFQVGIVSMGSKPMEASMSDRDRPGRDLTGRELRTKRDLPPDPMLRTSRGTAMWSLVTAIAIVFVLFVAFYGISAQRENTVQSTVNSRAVTAASRRVGRS